MCVEVHNSETNKTACTVKELAEMLNVTTDLLIECRHIQYESGVLVDGCLCQLDVFEACDRAGYEAKHNKVYDIEIWKRK